MKENFESFDSQEEPSEEKPEEEEPSEEKYSAQSPEEIQKRAEENPRFKAAVQDAIRNHDKEKE